MHVRGRSREVSPIALVRAALTQHKTSAEISTSFALSPHDNQTVATREAHLSSARLQPQAVYVPSEQPMASSSRLEPPPQLSSSHSSSASSLDQTPAPTTPPMFVNEVYNFHHDNEVSLDYYDSPPSPPRTLQDQMQVAYALDNMHLAKVLLLKLKGIEVTDDQDPRIAQVKDEDFSETFVPRGGLRMTKEAEQLCMEGQRRERERWRRIARDERLKICERIWDNGARSYQEAKARAARKKEAETRVRRLADLEARQRDRERVLGRETTQDSPKHRRTMRTTCGVPRPILSYDTLPASYSRQLSTSRSPPERGGSLLDYEYTMMCPTSSARVSNKPRSQPASPNSAYRELAALSSTNVPFSDVVLSMQGALFRDDEITPCKRGKTLVEIRLLETLLESPRGEVRSLERDKLTKGKARAGVGEDCIACTHEYNSHRELSSSASSTTTITRSISWFSFSSRSNTSTAATTPSTSPMSVKVFQPLSPAGKDASSSPVKHSCRRPRIKRLSSAPLSSTDNPLTSTNIPPVTAVSMKNAHSPGRGRSLGKITDLARDRSSSTDSAMLATGTTIVARMSRSVTTFFDMAAQLQRAYVKATMYTASPDMYFSSNYPGSRSRSRSSSRSCSLNRTVSGSGRRRERGSLRPQGYRASCDDVLTFTAADQGSASPSPERPLIPLSSTRPTSSSVTNVPRVFPPPLSVPRSPFRPAQPPACLTSRLRPIANPLLLRLCALHNVYGGVEKEVLEVREKVVGVAWEGIGRSGLIWEVKPAHYS
ncbi:hypothetical protein BC835DRAFT_1421617 [Cytidiella melzeri]|nr:hypothetical protein BC835DRAFT_1421617 [Cytidiella melzeri]